MTKTTTQKIIDSTSYLIGYSDNPAKVISDICKTHQLTHDFICEFYSYITKEMFTLSYKLLPSLAEQYPELFDEELFLKAVSMCEEENEDGPIFDFPGEDSDSNKTEDKKIKPEDISLAMLIKYIDIFKSEPEKYVYFSEFDCFATIKTILREADQEEFNDVFVMMGISPETDEIILQRVKDPELKNTILLSISCDDNSDTTVTSASLKYMSNELKENMLGSENVDPSDFVSALAESSDFIWVLSMIKKAVSGEIQFEKTTKTFDRELVLLLNKLPEDQIIKFISLRQYMPIAFSSTVLAWLLKNKSFSEDQFIEMKELYKQAGLGITLRKFAIQNDYKKLLENF